MKQIDKLYNFIKNPYEYGIRKNTRVYRCICDLVCYGVAKTGYSDRNRKYIDTWNIINTLNRIGIACRYSNIASRGGACGERVYLKGTVRKDCLNNYNRYIDIYLQDHPKKYTWDVADSYIKSLQN